MKSPRRALVLAATTLTGVALLAGCTASPEPEGGGKTKITVASLIPGTAPEAFAAFDAQVAQFEKLNPDIDVVGSEYEWKATTFAAQLAGGTLPDVYRIPLTDGKTMIANGQLADITADVKALPYYDQFNPSVFSAVQDDSGNIFGLPREAYATGLQYNRTLFTQAGLDPDKPPTTWDEVRKAAKIISEKTGQAGYMQMTKDATGGWQLTAATLARGGNVEEGTGTDVKVTFENEGTKDALKFLKALRWEDNSMGANFIFDWGTINQAFAAGQIGMFTGGSDLYTSLVRENNLNPDDYGLTAIPLSDSPDAAVMGGGTLNVVNVKASADVQKAAVKWIDFYDMQKLLNEDAAVLDAQTLVAADQAVGTPRLPVFDQNTLNQYNEWIADFINVPQDQVKFFADGNVGRVIAAEPASHSQELYGALSVVVQAVLTDQNADIDALLKEANITAQAIVDAG